MFCKEQLATIELHSDHFCYDTVCFVLMPSREFVICLFVSYVMHIVRRHLKEALL